MHARPGILSHGTVNHTAGAPSGPVCGCERRNVSSRDSSTNNGSSCGPQHSHEGGWRDAFEFRAQAVGLRTKGRDRHCCGGGR